MNINKWALSLWMLLAAVQANSNGYSVQQVEPLSWWVGMQHPDLQLMVHGESIAELSPSVDYPNVAITSVEKTDNKNYLFINLHISNSASPGLFQITFTRNGKVETNFRYRLNARRNNSSARRGFDASDAIYLVVPDRFANGNPANDSSKNLSEKVNRTLSGGRHGGDIKGLQDHLDYIAEMGFTMIWPTPLVENNMQTNSYHGYSATDFYHIDNRFGSNLEYKNFVAAANKKGLGVIQDLVLNHIGSGHWWMKDLPAGDWLNIHSEYTETSHRRTTVHDIHAAPEDTQLFTDGWFVKSMPDLNQRNPLLATYLMQNSVWWIEYANLSGIREDTYSYSDKKFLAAWGKYILDEYPHFNMVGEEWTNNSAIIASWQKDKKNEDGYESHMPSMMDFPVLQSLRSALTETEGQGGGLLSLYETIANDFIYADPMHLVVFAENHDTSRIFSAVNENMGLYKNAMVFVATTRGIPQYLYGSEVLMKSPLARDDGAVRADLPGGWQSDMANIFTGINLTLQQRETQNFLKKLLNWRRASDAIKVGKLLHYVPENSVYVYFRYTNSQCVMVVINKNTNDTQLNLARFTSALKGRTKGHSVLTDSEIDLTKPLQLSALTPVIIEL